MNNKERLYLNSEAKQNVILESGKGVLARKLDKGDRSAQIKNIMKNKDQILKGWETSMNQEIKTKEKSKCEQVKMKFYMSNLNMFA